MPVPITSRTGSPITTLEEWEARASTKGKWADGFSAKELARLWLTDAGPTAAADAVRAAFGNVVFDSGVAEAQVSFDGYRGGVRNHDVLARGRAASGNVIVGIEGKVNESLDDTVTGKYATAAATRAAGKNTNLDARVDALLAAIVGRTLADDPALGSTQYQLLSAVAGTVAAADEDTIGAAVVVHLISTAKASPAKFAETRSAVDAFGAALGCRRNGPLVGPFIVDTTNLKGPADLPCWVSVVESPPADG